MVIGVILIGAGLAGCRIVPNENPEDKALTLANPTLATKQTVLLTPAPNNQTEGESMPITPTIANPTGKPGPANLAQAAKTVTLTTNKGAVTLRLYPEKAPKTVANFLAKAKSGFYNALTFHRVEDWVVQGGDPLGTGTGGGSMPTELNDVPFKIGSLGVARGGNKAISNDAQFFICTKDCSWLTGDYTNFGEVVEGMEVVNQIQIGDTINSIMVAEP